MDRLSGMGLSLSNQPCHLHRPAVIMEQLSI
jgi:hypothetical protein